jgi:hypothetical protein
MSGGNAGSTTRPIAEYCRCDWMKEVEALQDCGCGRDDHHVRLYRDVVVHWKGGHWRIECAFEDAFKMLRNAS